MKKLHLTSFYLLILLVLVSCKFTKDKTVATGGEPVKLSYAKNLTLTQYEDYTLATMLDPWNKGLILHEYVLIDKTGKSKEEMKSAKAKAKEAHPNATIVPIPLQKAAIFTSVHCAMLHDLGVESSIGGVADLEYIYLPYIKEGVLNGRIANLGNSMQPNIERIMNLLPDALMPSPFQNSGGYGQMENTGIPIIECADYMEVSPLARAEWIKFYGRLFGVAERADSIFTAVETSYNTLKEKASQVQSRPTLLAEKLSGAVWYVPAGESTMGIMYRDAGANYLWADIPESGSLQKSIEHVIERGINADVWIFKYNQEHDMTYKDLAEENTIYKQFSAFKQHRVFGCNTQDTDFYEETPFHPERLLASLLQILHPELPVSASKNYFRPLEE